MLVTSQILSTATSKRSSAQSCQLNLQEQPVTFCFSITECSTPVCPLARASTAAVARSWCMGTWQLTRLWLAGLLVAWMGN